MREKPSRILLLLLVVTCLSWSSDSSAADEWTSPVSIHISDGPADAHAAVHPCDCRCGVCRDPGRPQKPHRTLPGDVDRGACPPYRYLLPDCERAGSPHCVAWWAAPAITEKYSAWFVGGGSAFGGRLPCRHEGTWGLDYHGCLKPRRVWLRWTYGREQGGEGAYETEAHTDLLHE